MKKIYATLTTLFLLQSLLFAQAPGTLDPSFGSAGKAYPAFGASSDYAYPVIALPDGSVLLGGSTNYNISWEFAIAKRLPDGSPDISFGADPKDWVPTPGLTHFGAGTTSMEMQDMALLPNGRIICVGIAYKRNTDGSYTYSVRAELFEPNGTRVPGWTFASFSAASTNRLGFVVKAQPDGKFIIAAFEQNTNRLEIGRFQASGSRDLSFGTNGAISLPMGGWWPILGIRLALQSDGKILAATTSGTTANRNIVVVRLLSSGQLDATFGTSGTATLDVGDDLDVVADIHPMPDGKIFLTGWTSFDAAGSTPDALLARLLSNGQPDPSFGTAGQRTHAIGTVADYPKKSILLPDGKILLAGYEFATGTPSKSRAFTARFLPNGDKDLGFANNGSHWISHPNNTQFFGLAALPNGGAVLGGYSDHPISGRDFLLEAIDAAGQPSPGFGTQGIVDLPLDGGVCALQASACLPDGKILVAGSAFSGGGSIDFCVGRLLPDGSTDLGFGQQGRAFAGFVYSGTEDYAYDMALAPDGKIVVAGYTDSIGGGNTRIALARFLPNGTLDNGFNGSGKVAADWSTKYDLLNAVTVQPDDKIVAAGWYNSKECAVARFLPNGKNDPAFGINGLKNWLIGAEKSEVNAVSILSDGSILAAGEAYFPGSGSQFSITKLKSDGLFDPGFGTGGQATFPLAGTSDAFCNDLAVQADGKILLTGSISLLGDDNGIATLRLLPNGTLDASFGTNGWSLIGVVGDVDIPPSASSVKVQPDGKILLAGLGGPLAKTLAARLLPNGSLDPTFGDAGIFLDAPDTLNVSAASSVSLQLDGKIVLAGFFTPDLYNVGPVVYRLISGLSVGVIDRPQAMSQPLIYPNPVRESQVAVEYELPAPSLVRIELLDLQGRNLATLLDAERFSGKNTETLALPSGLAQGLYLLNVQTERGNVVVKIEVQNP